MWSYVLWFFNIQNVTKSHTQNLMLHTRFVAFNMRLHCAFTGKHFVWFFFKFESTSKLRVALGAGVYVTFLSTCKVESWKTEKSYFVMEFLVRLSKPNRRVYNDVEEEIMAYILSCYYKVLINKPTQDCNKNICPLRTDNEPKM